MKKFAVLLLGLFTSLAMAGEATLSWTAPTQRTDGSALTNLDGFKIYYGTQPTTLTLVQDIPDETQTTHVLSGLSPATWYFAMTAYDTDGLESDKSGTVSKVIVPAPPMPPGNLTVTATVAYTVVKRTDRFVMLPVGTVPADTQCDLTQNVNGYYVVPRAAVSWSGNVKPDVVVAQCG